MIQSYDPAWPDRFHEQAARLTSALALWLVAPLEHIGSTSIPGLAAKPIIDMVALVSGYETFHDALPAAESVGWLHAPEPGDVAQRKWSLCFPSIEHRTHHLHVVEQESTAWPQWLAFRDYLRDHPAVVQEYARLKIDLARADDTDRPRYRAAKAPFIENVLSAAMSTRRAGS